MNKMSLEKIKKIIRTPRIIILIILLILAAIAIQPRFIEGVAVRTVMQNSSASLAGMQNPAKDISPTSREVIIQIDSISVKNTGDYYGAVSKIKENSTVLIKTNKNLYRLNIDKVENKALDDILGLKIYDAPKSNIKKGLDLEGGTRVLLIPERKLSSDEANSIIGSIEQRLNVFGLTDLTVKSAADLSGNQYILVEIAGVNEEEVKELISRQGKFEAKIGNETVFTGGKDITYVCRSADCSGIDPAVGCSQANSDQWACRFFFSVSLREEAAKKQFGAIKDLEIVTENSQQYLSLPIELFLDDSKVDELRIGAELKQQVTTQIAISGSGFGLTRQEAIQDSLSNMNQLQTILETGSLPVKLNIVKTDLVSPVFGEEFIRNAMLVGLISILAVGAVIFIRYRLLKISLPMMFTVASEIVLMLGFASLVGWNLDLAAIAGIIVAAGTGVDDQIVITDETLRGEKEVYDWKKRLKRAFGIIIAAYATGVASMFPLLFAGAGLLKGFAFVTIVGISIGVFITRPAFAAIVEKLVE